MKQLINEPDIYQRLFANVTFSAFKFETRKSYGVADEDLPFQQFLAGNDPGIEWLQSWLDLMRESTARGVCVDRVRVIDTPPSDYQRFEIAITPHNLDAGENIKYASRSDADKAGLPTVDFWLFDSTDFYVVHFADDDQFLGLEEVKDPTTISTYAQYRDRAREIAREL